MRVSDILSPPRASRTASRFYDRPVNKGWKKGESRMSVAKIIEISSESPESFEAAIHEGIARASKTVKNIRSAWIKEQQVKVENAKIVAYRVDMMVTFVLND